MVPGGWRGQKWHCWYNPVCFPMKSLIEWMEIPSFSIIYIYLLSFNIMKLPKSHGNPMEIPWKSHEVHLKKMSRCSKTSDPQQKGDVVRDPICPLPSSYDCYIAIEHGT